MRTFLALGLLASLSGCFIGESLDSGPAADDAAPTATDRGASRDDAAPGPTAPPSSPPAPPSSSSPPATDAAPPPPSPSTLDAGVPDSTAPDSAAPGPCASAYEPVTVHVTGGAGSFSSNPPGITVATGGTTTACFPVGQTVVILEASQLLCNWSGATCKDGNTADRRCELVVGGPTSIAVVVP